MGIEYYGFAFFVFVLLSALIILCKILFSDVKRQNRLLDEKEEKLLRLYQTLEDSIEEFYDMVAESKSELDGKFKNMVSAAENIMQEEAPEANKGQKKQSPQRIEEEPVEFSVLLSEAERSTGEASVEPGGLHSSILNLSKSGKTKTQIAKELGITQTEVGLVIEMSNKIE